MGLSEALLAVCVFSFLMVFGLLAYTALGALCAKIADSYFDERLGEVGINFEFQKEPEMLVQTMQDKPTWSVPVKKIRSPYPCLSADGRRIYSGMKVFCLSARGNKIKAKVIKAVRGELTLRQAGHRLAPTFVRSSLLVFLR